VAGVPDDPVTGRLEDAVDGQRELDDAEVRAEVSTTGCTGADQLVRISLARVSSWASVRSRMSAGDTICSSRPMVIECRRFGVDARDRRRPDAGARG